MSSDSNELIGTARKYADAIDKDRGFESGLTDCLRGLADTIEALEGEVAKLQAFKDFVHRRLDTADIPTHPDGPHSAEGCRIGDRLDIALAAEARAERLRVALEGIAANADAASDLPLFRVQCRDFARKALEDDKQ
jgi:hypothetical protein